ncbi:MAG: HD domain-containing protein [Desulfarculus sp.]|nr:HD domain-containing protein [Desulfarculus sp.]
MAGGGAGLDGGALDLLRRPCCAGQAKACSPPAGGVECRAACGAITAEIHQFAESLGKAIDARDHFTRLHSEEVAMVAYILALRLGQAPALADRIHIAGHLHDLGKLAVPDRILLKPGPLTAEEWAVVRRHPEIGAEIIAPVDYLAQSGIVDMVRHHHERFDGAGYPQGLAGQAIPLGSRIIALADSLSAMLQARPYRPPLSLSQARDEISRHAGGQFDPEVTRAFLECREEVASVLQRL